MTQYEAFIAALKLFPDGGSLDDILCGIQKINREFGLSLIIIDLQNFIKCGVNDKVLTCNYDPKKKLDVVSLIKDIK
jgi:hypothetical protein